MKIKKTFLLVTFTFIFFSCQKKEVIEMAPPPPIQTAVINNRITSKHINIPNTKIYFVPFDNNYILSNGSMVSKDNNYTISILESNGKTSKNTVNDFDSKDFEDKDIRVFDNRFITINGVKSKILSLQGDARAKEELIFIDDITEKIMVTATYDLSNIQLENKIRHLLYSIVYNKNLKINYLKNANFNLDLSGTKFKFKEYNNDSYEYTENGRVNTVDEPSILVSQFPNIGNADLKEILNEVKNSSINNGLKDVEIKNSIEKDNSLQAEIYGNINGKAAVFFYKILKAANKDITIYFMASAKNNIEENLVKFKKVAKTFEFK